MSVPTPKPIAVSLPVVPGIAPHTLLRIQLLGQILSGLLSDSALTTDGSAGIREAVSRAQYAVDLVLAAELPETGE